MTTPQNPFEGQYAPEAIPVPVEPPTPAWEAFGVGLPLAPAAVETEDTVSDDGPVGPPVERPVFPQDVPSAQVAPGLPVSMPTQPPVTAYGHSSDAGVANGGDGPVAPAPAFSVAAEVGSLPDFPVAPPASAGTPGPAIPGMIAPSVPAQSAIQQPFPAAPTPPPAATEQPLIPQPPVTQPLVSPAPMSAQIPPHGDGPAAPLAGSAPSYEEVVEKVQEVALDDILMAVSEAGGSDLHIASDAVPRMRVRGEIVPIKGFQALTAEQVKALLYGIMTGKQQQKYEENLGLDFSYTVPGQARFRVNVFQQRGLMGGVMRSIPWEILTFEALNIPASIGEFSDLKNGLVLVTGPTGSGKSTTLAALIDRANRTRPDHIMTVEDPIEFIHQSRKCIVNQREVGSDTHSFADALKYVLRQDPDIILVGEMRDLETISIALTAAETGHLVFGTLHTQSAQDTITRIVDAYPAGEKAMVRTQLAASLRAVVCQTLVPTADGAGRQAALEVMVANSNIKSLIRDDKLQQIQSALQSGAKHGMWTLNNDLSRHVLAGTITLNEALDRCSDREDLLNLVGGGNADAAEEAAAKALKRAEEARQPEPSPLNPGMMFGGFPPPTAE